MSWSELLTDAWKWYSTNRADLTPIGAFLGGVVIAWAALRQAGIAARRHDAQTEADRQRRITESFSKAVEQLGSDKIETRLGGIYTLERISRESPTDYWPIMETLTAFVRERARWKEPDASASETIADLSEDEAPAATQSNHEAATDIAAVLSVIVRRGDKRDRELLEGWYFDLRGTDLRKAFFEDVHLERANLMGAHLEGANLSGAHLEGADLKGAHLERADFVMARLEVANLTEAHLEGAILAAAHLEGADLDEAHLEAANLAAAHLERANAPGSASRRGHPRAHEGAHARREPTSRERDLEGAEPEGAHLEGARLGTAKGLVQD